MLYWEMESEVLSSDYHKKDAPDDKDPPEGKELPNLFRSYFFRRLYHCHRDQFLAVTLS